jgi:chromosome segregation ATPase
MKSLVTVLSILIALLAFALWRGNASARAAATANDAAFAALSNRLAEANMKLNHQEQLAAVAQASLGERSREAVALSNAVSLLKPELARSLAGKKAAQSQAQELRDRIAAAETQSSGMADKLRESDAQVQSLTAALQKARTNEDRLESARAALANEAECLKIEKVELARQLNDPHALGLRLAALQAGFQPMQLRTNGSVAVSARLQQALRESSSRAAQ